ncbi:transcription factor Jun-like [Brachyhypopomus gauderio]|uniref:transcription factor Jun-like n=1 Tax=Brachyhypopomus gauderio TaxID=698409 RepID=UPI004041456F
MHTKMEATFYDEALSAALVSQHERAAAGGYKSLKRNMTLNLGEPSRTLKPHMRAKACEILTSPDVNLLKLASPELERLIIQSCNGLITTTPTPTQFLCPRNVTDEQEGFADGFVKALAELHYQQQMPAAASGTADGAASADAPPACAETPGAPYTCGAPAEYTNLGAYGDAPSCMGYDALPPQNCRSAKLQRAPPPPPRVPQRAPPPPPPPRAPPFKEEPQRVPDINGDTPPLSPIDMENQERIKAERKRMRNRVAASKCRKRKLERLARLEEKVKGLKSHNTELCGAANLLRDEVAQLKQKVMDHVNSGCRLILTQQMQAFRGALP